jgi:hypothetical protein
VTALAPKKALIPAAARLHVTDSDEGPGAHVPLHLDPGDPVYRYSPLTPAGYPSGWRTSRIVLSIDDLPPVEFVEGLRVEHMARDRETQSKGDPVATGRSRGA